VAPVLAEPVRAGWYARRVAGDPDDEVQIDADGASDAQGIAASARDRAHFEEEALGLADDVWRVARRLARDQTEAEDLVQEAYARAFRSWRSYQPGTNLRAWLLRIVHNLAIDQARRRRRAPEQEPLEADDYYLYSRLDQGVGAETPPTERLIERLSQGPILAALAELPQNFRDVVVYVDLAGLSYQEAADVLGIPIGTVMSRLHRGRRMIKTRLADPVLATGEQEE
jgi:RNA polymerase sigma-70 factor, ECF subfamily